MKKDLAFVMDNNIESESIQNQIKKSGGRLLDSIEVFDLYTGDNIGSDKKSIAYSLTFIDDTRTLSEEEVMQCFNNIIKTVESKMDAKLRDK